jgi:hypothetical protein
MDLSSNLLFSLHLVKVHCALMSADGFENACKPVIFYPNPKTKGIIEHVNAV